MTEALEGKVALVTGAGVGIGAAAAVQLAACGARVAVVHGDAEAANARSEAIAGSHPFPVNFDDREAMAALPALVAERMGAVDILVNAFAISGEGGSVLEPDWGAWPRIHWIDLELPALLISLSAQVMVRQGRGGKIVSVTSSSGSRAVGVRPAYGTAKAGLNALTRIAAAQLGQYDINVNAVAPGVTVTPLQRGLRNDDQMAEAVTTGPLENFFHRVSEPDDVAAAITFLCLPGSRQITGQVIHTSAGVVT